MSDGFLSEFPAPTTVSGIEEASCLLPTNRMLIKTQHKWNGFNDARHAPLTRMERLDSGHLRHVEGSGTNSLDCYLVPFGP